MDEQRLPTLPVRWILGLALLVSGASALILEIVWFNLIGLVFGNSVWATSVVLSSFMAGLALGNYIAIRLGDHLRRPLLAYGLMELAIGATGILLTIALPFLPAVLAPIFRHLQDFPWLINPLRLILSFMLLMIPTTAMGLTLPLVVGALSRSGGKFGQTLGVFYGLNTLGAVGGVILAETVLVLKFGIRGTAYMAAAGNVVAFLLAALISRWFGSSRTKMAPTQLPISARIQVAKLLVTAFLLGGALLALEVLWFRFVLMFVINNSLGLALMLVVVLAGIGIGGFFGAAIVSLPVSVTRSLSVLSLAAAATVVLTYRLFEGGLSGATPFAWMTVLEYSVRLMLPGAILSGALFTIVGQALKRDVAENTRTAGLLTFANTLGAMLGSLLGAFVLIPVLGVERSFFAIAVVYVLTAFLAGGHHFFTVPFRWREIAHISLGVGAVSFLAFFPFGLMRETFIPLIAKQFRRDGSKVIATRESTTETIFYMRSDWLGQPLHYRLVTNGFSMSGTGFSAKRYMRLYAFWPTIVSGKPINDVLVISYGVGVTASAVRDLPTVEHIDVVDISRAIVEMSDLVYTEDQHPLRDSRVSLHIEDGRQFLLSAKRRYDLITGEPPPPRLPGIVSLYSRDYFELIYNRLVDGGVTTYWLPIENLLEEDAKAIIRGFCEIFENCSVWNGTPSDWMLVGFRGDPQPTTIEKFGSWWQDPVIGPQLREIGLEVPGQLGATFLGDAEFWGKLTADTPPLTDNFPKRLRPIYAPPPRARERFFNAVINPTRARKEFAHSPLIQKLWPKKLRLETDRFFEIQNLVNTAIIQQPDPVGRIEQLHMLLTTTELSTLPLWWMGPTLRHLQIATEINTASIQRNHALALAALANRRYNEAAKRLRQLHARGVSPSTVPYLQVYALCMAGRFEEAAQSANPLRKTGTRRAYWVWLDETFREINP